MTEVAEGLLGVVPNYMPSFLAETQKLNPESLGANLSLAIAVIVVLFWNFISNRLWTYSDVE
jgi:putative flippase GtrA